MLISLFLSRSVSFPTTTQCLPQLSRWFSWFSKLFLVKTESRSQNNKQGSQRLNKTLIAALKVYSGV